MGVIHKKTPKVESGPYGSKTRKKVARIKLEFDKELEILSGTILFPEKLVMANKFLSKAT
jgi:hypothetical protein